MPSFLSLILFTLYFTIQPLTSAYANEDKVWVTHNNGFNSCTKLEDNKDRTVLKCKQSTILTLNYKTSILTIVDSRGKVFIGKFGCSKDGDFVCSSYVKNEEGVEKEYTSIDVLLKRREFCTLECKPLF